MQRPHEVSLSRKRPAARLTFIALLSALMVVVTVSIAAAHDLFVKPVAYFVAANSSTLVRVLNGTFTRSDNAISRPRVQDISVVSPAGRARLDTTEWNATGDTSSFRLRTGAPGTYVIGVSTRPSGITLTAEQFNQYLREDGIPDELEARRRAGELDRGARESYHKHVKAFVQVGPTRTDDYATELGYPAELVPLSNPYRARVGQSLRVRTLVDGQPVANTYVVYGGRTLSGQRIRQRAVRSDSTGVASVPLRTRGTWYIKFIHMSRLTGDTLDYESKWTTMTFQLR